jgi:cytochrome c556
MKSLFSISLAAILSVGAVTAVAAVAKSEAEAKTAIEARSQNFKDLGKAMGPIGDMLRRKVPFDAAVVATNSAKIQEIAPKIPGFFETDTRQFHGSLKTEALDGIWNSQADFKAKADDLAKAAAALNAAAKTGDQAETLKAAGAVGKACGTCHDSYRVKKQQ